MEEGSREYYEDMVKDLSADDLLSNMEVRVVTDKPKDDGNVVAFAPHGPRTEIGRYLRIDHIAETRVLRKEKRPHLSAMWCGNPDYFTVLQVRMIGEHEWLDFYAMSGEGSYWLAVDLAAVLIAAAATGEWDLEELRRIMVYQWMG